MLAAKVAFRTSRFLHDHRLHWVVEQAKCWRFDRLVLEPGRDEAKDPPPLGAADRERLADHFRPDVAAPSDLVGRDLVRLWLGGGETHDVAAADAPPVNAVRRAARKDHAPHRSPRCCGVA